MPLFPWWNIEGQMIFLNSWVSRASVGDEWPRILKTAASKYVRSLETQTACDCYCSQSFHDSVVED